MIKFDISKLLQAIEGPKLTTKLNEKLVDENFPIEEYLKNDKAIICFKYKNKNTKNYLTKDKIKKLIKYIIDEPKTDDYLTGHKYPYISYEMLKCDCPYIQDLFILTDEEYKEKYKNAPKSTTSIDKVESSNNVEKSKISTLFELSTL